MDFKKTCILITSEYPYKKAETFLEDEIVYLSKEYDRVLIFAISAGEDAENTRVIPGNVSSFGLNNADKVTSMFKGIIDRDRKFKHDNWNIASIVVDLYFKGKACHSYKSITDILSCMNFSETEDIIIYSYWLVSHAIVAIKLKTYFEGRGVNALAVSRTHGYDLYEERNRALHLPYRVSLLSGLDGIFPCSENGCKYLSSRYPTMNKKIHLARLGTMDYGVNNYKIDDCFTIVTCSSLIPLKRIKLFAEAFSVLISKKHNVRWVCIGDGPEYSEIYDIICKHKIIEAVEFKGNLPHSEVIKYYIDNYVDLFCNVSIYEGVPVSIMEAQSFGIPVLATNVGGTSEILNFTNGVLVKKDISANDLAEAIERYMKIINNNSLDIRKNVRKSWEEKSNSNVVYMRWINAGLSKD